MEKRFQVFVSSTYSDLKDEREKVIHELTRVGFIAVGMEQFPATDEEQLEYIQKIIDESDYYVVIIRGKYGSLTSDGLSFTEKECDYALETKKPVLEPIRKEVESLESVMIPCRAPGLERGASCGSRNIVGQRIGGGCATRAI